MYNKPAEESVRPLQRGKVSLIIVMCSYEVLWFAKSRIIFELVCPISDSQLRIIEETLQVVQLNGLFPEINCSVILN